jgi:hypothetical protein
MNNNTQERKKKKDLPVNSDAPKRQQKAKITKGDVMDMSAAIMDIENDTPDIATWNKKIHIKDDAAGILDNKSDDAKTPPPTTIGIGLRQKKRSKDLIMDPANKKDVDEALKSGLASTDEAEDLY